MADIASLAVLPEPTGPYRIGSTKYDLEDPYRKNYQSPNGRLIPIQIYFPLEMGPHVVSQKIFEDRAALGPFDPLQINGFSHPAGLSLLIEGRHPIIFINHASYVAMTDYAFLAEDLSSHGYLVISIQHDLESDNEEPIFWEGSSCSRNAKIIDNILFAFEWLKVNQKTKFQDKIDIKRVGLIGHSLGANSLALWVNRTPNTFFKDKRAALFHRMDQQDVKECVVLMEATRFSFPFNNRFPLFFLLAEDRERYHKETGCYEQMAQAGHKVEYYAGSTHISFMDHGVVCSQNVTHKESYFNGSLDERKRFFTSVRQDVRDFLNKCGV